MFLFVLIAVIIAAVSAITTYKTFHSYSSNIIKDMEGEALRIDRSMIIEINSASYLLESLARQIVQTGVERHEDIARLLSSFYDSNSPNNNELVWLNVSQQVIITSGSGVVPKPINASDRDFIKKALVAPWKVHVGRPVQGRVTERWILPLSLGVTDYKGNFIGTIVLNIDIETLTRNLQSVVQRSGVRFAILTKTLSLLTDSYENAPEDQPVQQAQQDLANIVFANQRKGIVRHPELFSPSVPFSYYEASSQYPYVIHLTYYPRENDDQIVSLLLSRVAQIVLLTLFLLFMLGLVRARIVRPVERLSYITSIVAAGGRYTPLPRGGPLEIEELAAQIRKLSAYVAEQDCISQELKQKNQFLTHTKDTSIRLTKTRSEFLHDVISEIQKPLQNSIRHLNAVQQSLQGNATHPSAQLSDAIRQLDRTQHMLQDLRYIAQREFSTILLRETSVNVAFSIQRAIRKFHDYPDYQHIDVRFRHASVIPALRINEERFIHIIIYLLCGASSRLMQGRGIELDCDMEYNEKGVKELVLQLRYATYQADYYDTLPDHASEGLLASGVSIADEYDAGKDHIFPLHVKSDILCFSMARMMVSLCEGDMTIGVAKDDLQRIMIRFPVHKLIYL